MGYLGGVLGAMLSALFIIFVILSFGYAVGAIKVKGVSLGSAGVLLVAIVCGVIFFLCGNKDANNNLLEFSFTLDIFRADLFPAHRPVDDIKMV
jgi:hypothetical protein